MNYLRLTLLLAILVTSLFGASWSQEDADEEIEEEVYLSFRYGGVIDEIVVAYYSAGNFYLPLTALLDLFAVNYELSSSSLSVSGYYMKEDDRYLLDFTGRIASFKSETFKMDVNDFLIKEVDFFVHPKILESLFGLKLKTDLSRLTLTLETSDELPVIARHKRRLKKNLKDSYAGSSSISYYELHADRQLKVLEGAFGDYSLSSNISQDHFNNNFNLRLGGELLYGDVQASMNTLATGDTILINGSDMRWHYANMSEKWFTNASLGQFGSSGPTNSTYQGFLINNEPLTPQVGYDTYVIEDLTEAEAEVELYQDNRLVEITRADESGYFRFFVPLNYGTSDFKIRIYAKQGRIIELDKRIQVPFNFLKAGDYRYEISGGQVSSATQTLVSYSNMMNSKFSMGVNDWMTAEMGVEYVADNYRDQPMVYANVSTRLAGDILLGLDVALNNYYRISMRGVGPNTSSVAMEYTFYNPEGALNFAGYRHRFLSNLFYPFRLGALRVTSRASGSWIATQTEDRINFNLDLSQNIGRYRLQYGVKEQHAFSELSHRRQSQLSARASYSVPRLPSLHKFIRGSYFGMDMNYNTLMGSLEEVGFQYYKKIGPRLKARFISKHDLIQENAYYEIGFTYDLEVSRTTSTIRTDGVSSHSFAQTLRGSVGLDRQNGQFLWDNRQQVGRSAISVRMYVDENGSDSYDDGEEIIPGNALSLERSSSRIIEKSGIFHMTQLQPYRRYNFRVNEARVKNPMLVASKKKFSIITDPNTYKRIDVPFYTTGIIDGRVDMNKGGESEPISGMRIHIKSTDRKYDRTLTTFADGSYYLMEIPPGNYEMWVDESQLEFLGVNSIPGILEFTVHPSADGDLIEDLNFILE